LFAIVVSCREFQSHASWLLRSFLTTFDIFGGPRILTQVLRRNERICAEYSTLAPPRHAVARGQVGKGHNIPLL
jgi:hypothetical protein